MSRVSPGIRREVRERSGGRCEYCRKPEGFSTYSHQVEHIISRKHGGNSYLDNLAWACFQCNNSKGSDIAAFDEESAALASLFNPRMESWDEHFVMDDGEIIGITATGRVTVRLLQMNHPEQVETRLYLMEAGIW